MKSIYEKVRDAKHRYEYDSIDSVEGMDFNMHDRIVENEFLSNSRYQSGDYDENGDIKPFHDIITRILDNARSAEEVDTKDMVITSDDSDYYVRTDLLSAYNQDWMAAKNMDKFHNEAIETRGKHGGLLVKVTETKDDLDLHVVDWTKFSGDAADLENGLKVVESFYTPAALKKEATEMGWDMDAVNKAIKLYAEADQDEDYKEQRETTGEYIKVCEISGVLEKSYLPEFADDESAEDEYVYQIHYLAGSEFHSEKEGDAGVTLDSIELDESPYYYLPYKKRTVSGKELGVGLVEKARHGQISTNIGAQQYKYSMDLASTHVLQSSSKKLAGKNVLTNMKRGTILKYEDGKPVSGVDMSPQALAHMNNFLQTWQNQVDRSTGTYSVATGEELPSGTPYRLGAILDQNAQSNFDLRREEYSIFMNRIYKERIIPFFIRQIKKQDKLNLKFSPDKLKQIDKDVSNYLVNNEIFDLYLNGEFDNVPPAMRFAVMDVRREEMLAEVGGALQKGKNRRKIGMFPKGYWEGVADKVYIDIVGERRDKGTVLESGTTLLTQYVQMKPMLEQDENARKIFNQIVEAANFDPIDWTASTAPAQQLQGQINQKAGGTPLDNPEELSAKPQ